MTPEKVWDRFIAEFPHMANQVDRWYRRKPNHRSHEGADSIRIILKNKRVLIFKVFKNGTWALERE